MVAPAIVPPSVARVTGPWDRRVAVRPGDTLTVRREIIEIRPSKSQPDRGVVRTKTTVTNQDGDLAMSFENQMQLPRNAEARL